MQITINKTTYSATFNFNALDKLMEANECEYFSQLGSLLGEDETEVSRSTIKRYAELVIYGIEEHNRMNNLDGAPDMADIKPLLIENPDILEQLANELSNALPQDNEDEQEGGDAEKKGQKKSQPKNSSKANSSAS
jgi:hypothetical protein